MSRASEYARSMKAAREAGPVPFVAAGDQRPLASVDEDGNLFLLPTMARLLPADVRRFILWLHAAFDEEPS